MITLKIIIGSTRADRKGPSIASWIFEQAKNITRWNVELIDLAEVNLPLLDEPNHPRFKKYEHEHTKRWSTVIDAADAFIFITPEYNHGFPASLKNAIDYLAQEWAYKPAAFVSYGGIAGGTRAVQMLKQVLASLKMVPQFEAVHIPFFTKQIDEKDQFIPSEQNRHAAEIMLKELLFWAEGLKSMRASRM
jgi:NAD(P)H-dependent FMN reductase